MVQEKLKWRGATKSGNGLNHPIPVKLLCVSETQSSYSFFLSFISHFQATIFLVQKPEILHENETSAGDGSPQKSIIFYCLFPFCSSLLQQSCATASFSAAVQVNI